MDEAERVEIAGHVGRLGTELIRFAELARARLNAMQDRGVPNLSLEDQPHPAIYLEAGLGPWGKDKGDTLHRWRSSPVQRPRDLPEPPESPGPGGYFLEAPRRHCRASVQSQERSQQASLATALRELSELNGRMSCPSPPAWWRSPQNRRTPHRMQALELTADAAHRTAAGRGEGRSSSCPCRCPASSRSNTHHPNLQARRSLPGRRRKRRVPRRRRS
ncbi:unnamed protein product, partial [Durusdinium trenchii]